MSLASTSRGASGSFGRNVIAVIGINHYRHWPRLSNAVRDANGAAALFDRLGFEQITAPLLDERATGRAIHELVTDELMELGPEDSLVLFYAGHGGTRTQHPGGQEIKTGYLIPVDASDSPTRAATWIELEGWLRAVSRLSAKHILVILDACHSGIALDPILKWRDVSSWRDTPLSTLRARRSRRIITSALDDQVALDSGPRHGHSLFTGCLVEGLTGGIQRQGSGWITTGSELGLYVQRRVETYPGSRQTPDFGTFDFDDRGEMVIPLVPELHPHPIEDTGAEGLTMRTALVPGVRVNQYELIEEHARGQMSIVFRARDLRLGRPVVIKFLQTDQLERNQAILAEARATARCQHENITVIYEVGEYEGEPYLVLEDLNGKTLAELIGDGQRLPYARAVEIACSILRALQYAHESGIVHQNLKPGNIFVTETGAIKVLNFGTTQLLQAIKDLHESGSHGAGIGTQLYMSPEQWLEIGVDHLTDVWVCGLLLYQMICGCYPLPASRISGFWRFETPMPSMAEAAPTDVPSELVQIVDRCLRKRKQERWQSARELLAALEPFLRGTAHS